MLLCLTKWLWHKTAFVVLTKESRVKTFRNKKRLESGQSSAAYLRNMELFKCLLWEKKYRFFIGSVELLLQGKTCSSFQEHKFFMHLAHLEFQQYGWCAHKLDSKYYTCICAQWFGNLAYLHCFKAPTDQCGSVLTRLPLDFMSF